ncbi:MAG: acyl-CoA dehydrogenase family protein [Deltaproteobacteria bacterium]|nr:acyl-CoA dehydrogenase family protein [Deltaproteobacteria bacterium]
MTHYEKMNEAVGHNWYRVDPNLRFLMDRFIAPEDRAWVEEKLDAMGELMGTVVAANAEIIDKNPPQLVRWDKHGEETNRVVHHPAALDTKRRLWKAGFLGLPWSQEARDRGRPVPESLMMAYLYLLNQAETGMACSVGMTNGVLRLVERYGDEATKKHFVPKLSAMDFDEAYDGSMFMTERTGGSDVGAIESTARFDGKVWRLDGLKWFSSNVDGKAIATLARPEGAPKGIKGLALFVLPKFMEDGSPNGVHIRRIKDKLGTRAVPTGEVDFVDATGYLLAGPDQNALDGRGINRMMEMVTESRLGVAAMGAGISRRSFLDAAIYATQRVAWGKKLEDHPMVREEILKIMVESEASAAMLFKCTSLVSEASAAGGRESRLLRMLVPLTKIRCTRRGIENASAAIEVFGANGYIENWPTARQFRDAQCHTIWEGPENILALDLLRAMAKEQAHEGALAFIAEVIGRASDKLLAEPRRAVEKGLADVKAALGWLAQADQEIIQLRARRLANLCADVLQGALLLDEAAWELAERGLARKAIVAALFARERLSPDAIREIRRDDRIVLDLYHALTRYEDIKPAEAAKHLA